MAKEIMQSPSVSNTAERHSNEGTNVPAFEAVLFKRVSASSDFGRSQTIALPERHSAEATAWAAVFSAMQGDADLIGGEIRPLGP